MKIFLSTKQIEKKIISEHNWTTTRFTWDEGFNELDHTKTTYSIVDEVSVFVDDIGSFKRYGGKCGVIDVQCQQKLTENEILVDTGLPKLLSRHSSTSSSFGNTNPKEYLIFDSHDDFGIRHMYYYHIVKMVDNNTGLHLALTIRAHYTEVEEDCR